MQAQHLRHMPRYILPLGCYQYRGSPSSLRVQVLMKNQRTVRQSAYGPVCLSYRKKQDLQPCCLGAVYDLYHHLKLLRSKACRRGYAPSCMYQLLGAGNVLGLLSYQ